MSHKIAAYENVPQPDTSCRPEISARNDCLITEKALATRWNLASAKKLQADRASGTGCPYVKIGRAIRYRLSDVVAYETANLRNSTLED